MPTATKMLPEIASNFLKFQSFFPPPFETMATKMLPAALFKMKSADFFRLFCIFKIKLSM